MEINFQITNIINEMGFNISDQSHASIIITAFAAETFSTEQLQNQGQSLVNRLKSLGYDDFRIQFIGNNQFKMIEEETADENWMAELYNWATEEKAADENWMTELHHWASEEKAFEDELQKWANQEGGQHATKAIDRVKAVFEGKKKKLALSNLKLTSLPPGIGQLSNLEEFNLINGQLKYLPSEIGNLANLKRMQINCGLTSLPIEIGNLLNLKALDLGNNQLKVLPVEIGKLVNLKNLNLKSVQLTTLPAEISDLSNLRKLNLKSNQLTILPAEIGHLAHLNELNLESNLLTTLPAEIGNLSELIKLNLKSNQLTILPAEIGNLSDLRELNLESNQLTTISPQIAQLSRLRSLNISGNPELANLPLSLGQCSQLTYIDITGTLIPQERVDAILNMCKAKRDDEAINVLLARLQAWKTFSEELFELDFIDTLPLKEKQIINEWMIRLEQTRDFTTTSQQSLAKAVCHILQSLKEFPSFKKLFFDQVSNNLECCSDRAAMAFNELYLVWKLETLDPTMSGKNKLDLMVRAAKTIALRSALQQLIAIKESEQKRVENESVEIYLFYETHLKTKLNLLTFMSTMSYSHIGKREWIDEESLVHEIEKNHVEVMMDFSSFTEMRDAHANYQSLWKPYQKEFDDRLELLDEQFANNLLKGGDYTTLMRKIDNERKEMEKIRTREWLENMLSNSRKRPLSTSASSMNEQPANKR